MPTTKKTKQTGAVKPSAGKKAPRQPEPEHLSALDAAARVLAHAPAEGMSAKQLIAEMHAKGLWSSPTGKTPHATLAAAIVREINTKGEEARFARVAPGRFTLAKPNKKPRSRPARPKSPSSEVKTTCDGLSQPAPRKRRRAGAAK